MGLEVIIQNLSHKEAGAFPKNLEKNGEGLPCADKTVIWEKYEIGIC